MKHTRSTWKKSARPGVSSFNSISSTPSSVSSTQYNPRLTTNVQNSTKMRSKKSTTPNSILSSSQKNTTSSNSASPLSARSRRRRPQLPPSFSPLGRKHSILLDPQNPISNARDYVRHKMLPPRVHTQENRVAVDDGDDKADD
jgi:hypothetical protein